MINQRIVLPELRRESWPPSGVDVLLDKLLAKFSQAKSQSNSEGTTGIILQNPNMKLERLLIDSASDELSEPELVNQRVLFSLDSFTAIPSDLDPLLLSQEELSTYNNIWQSPIESGHVAYNALSRQLISLDASALLKLLLGSNNSVEYPLPKNFSTTFLWTVESIMSPYTFLQILIIYYRLELKNNLEEQNKRQNRAISILIDMLNLQYDCLRQKSSFSKLLYDFLDVMEYGADFNVLHSIKVKKTLKMCHKDKCRLLATQCPDFGSTSILQDSTIELLSLFFKLFSE